jgi:hypothetical protein
MKKYNDLAKFSKHLCGKKELPEKPELLGSWKSRKLKNGVPFMAENEEIH